MLKKFCYNAEIGAVQRNAHLVDLEKGWKMNIYFLLLQRSASIQPRTSPKYKCIRQWYFSPDLVRTELAVAPALVLRLLIRLLHELDDHVLDHLPDLPERIRRRARGKDGEHTRVKLLGLGGKEHGRLRLGLGLALRGRRAEREGVYVYYSSFFELLATNSCWQTLKCPCSVVSKPIFASKCSFERSWRDPQDLQTFAPLRIQKFT